MLGWIRFEMQSVILWCIENWVTRQILLAILCLICSTCSDIHSGGSGFM